MRNGVKSPHGLAGANLHAVDRAVGGPSDEQALAVDPDKRLEWRLSNLIMQRRARWLLSREEELFLDAGSTGSSK